MLKCYDGPTAGLVDHRNYCNDFKNKNVKKENNCLFTRIGTWHNNGCCVLCYQFCIIISYIKIFKYLKYIIPFQFWITSITKESIKRVYMSYINNKLWNSGNTIIESDKRETMCWLELGIELEGPDQLSLIS